jgi:hypothetical protein
LVRMAGGIWGGFSCVRIRAVASCCECGDGPSGSGATELMSLTFRVILILNVQKRVRTVNHCTILCHGSCVMDCDGVSVDEGLRCMFCLIHQEGN